MQTTHVWQVVDLTLSAAKTYDNPYMEVDVWVDLVGPAFEKRVYGFWDGDNRFVVRITTTEPGHWTWASGSNQDDSGLNGQTGELTSLPWTEAELAENPCRRGMIRATANGHALQYADGTPYLMMGDTWWSTPTYRLPWDDEDRPHELGPDMSFQDMVRFRKAQGYNAIAMLAAHPAWANDGLPKQIWLDKSANLGVRDAWEEPGTGRAKDMHNEGGRPFEFPGRIPGYEKVFPDVERINPAYFRYMDRKVAYLNQQGFVSFIETTRRDCGSAWQAYYDWPGSYARFAAYVFHRYGAYNTVLSPIHYDWTLMAPPSRDYNAAANDNLRAYGAPPFGNLVSSNCDGCSYINFGNSDEAPWLTLHQIGNWRDHNTFWYLTQIYNESDPSKPSINGEPYYDGWPPHAANTPEAAQACRSGLYGGFLSGALGGHIYGATGIWGSDDSPLAEARMWDALAWPSGDQMRHLPTFVGAVGDRYVDLVPEADLVSPNKTPDVNSNIGWAFCARLPDKSALLVYFEGENPQAMARGAAPEATYEAAWFDPRRGAWGDAFELSSDRTGRVQLPPCPDQQDWGLKLVRKD